MATAFMRGAGTPANSNVSNLNPGVISYNHQNLPVEHATIGLSSVSNLSVPTDIQKINDVNLGNPTKQGVNHKSHNTIDAKATLISGDDGTVTMDLMGSLWSVIDHDTTIRGNLKIYTASYGTDGALTPDSIQIHGKQIITG